MPHFYNLSNNNEPTLKKQDQDKFPATEIHAIAYYLFTESKGNLEGKDAYRLALENGLDWQLQLLDVDIKPLLTTEDKKAWDRLLPLLSPEEGGSLKAEDKEKLESLLKIVVAGAKHAPTCPTRTIATSAPCCSKCKPTPIGKRRPRSS